MADEKINFADESVSMSSEAAELDIFGKSNYIRTPDVGESIELEVKALEQDKAPNRINKNGEKFHTGFKTKSGDIISYDIVTTSGERLNLKSAMLYYGVGGALKEYAKKHPGLKPSYLGAKLKITHLYNGNHATTKLPDLQKIKEFKTLEETQQYQEEVKKAMREFRIYEVKLLN